MSAAAPGHAVRTTAEDLFARAGLVRGETRRPPGRDRTASTAPPPRTLPRVRLTSAVAAAEVVEAPGPAHQPPASLEERVRVVRASDRTPVLDAADEDRPAVSATDAAALARVIAQATVEVLGGRRSPGQLARWVTPGVFEALHRRAALTVRVLGTSAATRPPTVRRARVCHVDPHVCEAAVVVEDGARVRAVAVRLESHRGTWRATSVEVG